MKDIQKVEQHVQQVIQARPKIGAIVETEPVILDLLKLAASQSNRSERWYLYETLKYACSQFVGWYAQKPELQTTTAYEAIIEALDLLLPSPEIESETLEDLDRQAVLQRLRDGILQINPAIKLPEAHKKDDASSDHWLTLGEIIDKYGL